MAEPDDHPMYNTADSHDAADFWCPFGRVGDADSAGFNRVDGMRRPEQVSPCIGHRCAAWVFTSSSEDTDASDWEGRCGMVGALR
ncbi:MAG: hypothetical protein ACOC93_05885 [Planctomycetota bacterium]